MANKFQITITAVDNATARIKQVKQQVAKFAAPAVKLEKSFRALGREIGLPKTAAAVRKVGVAIGDVTRKVLSLAAPMTAVLGIGSIGGLAILATSWARLGQAVGNSAHTIGISSSELTQLQGAARLTGVSAESLTSSMKSFGDTMEDAIYGRNTEAIAMFTTLGIGLNRTASGAVDSTRALGDLADEIVKRKNNPQAQNFIARQLGVEALLPMLRKGRAGIAELRRTVRAYGAELTGPQLRASEDFQQSLTKVGLATDGLWNSIMGHVLPVLSPLLTQLANWTSANRELIATKLEEWTRDLVEWVKKIDFGKLATSVSNFAQSAADALDSVGGFKGLLAGLAAIALAPLIGGVLSLAAAIVQLGTAASGLALGTAAVGLSKFKTLGRLGIAATGAYEGYKAYNSDMSGHDKNVRYAEIAGQTGGGWAGFRLGAAGGAMAGALLGPIGAAVGAVAGGIGGYLLGDWAGGKAGHALGEKFVPRGIRNNNPGNLRPSGDRWQGMSAKQTDRGFLQFDSSDAGLRAMAINLRNQTRKYGLDTIRSIINKYAPGSENDSNAYVSDVSAKTGFSPDQKLDLVNNPKQLSALMRAMVMHENGRNPYSDDQYQKIADAVTKGVNNANVKVDAYVNTGAPGTGSRDGISRAGTLGSPPVGQQFALEYMP